MWLRAATALPFLLWMRLPSASEGKDAGEPDVGGTAEDTITKATVESYYMKFAEAVGRKLEEVSENISSISAYHRPISHVVNTSLRDLSLTGFPLVALQIYQQD